MNATPASALDRMPDLRLKRSAFVAKDLPVFYYHTHFTQLLDAVDQRYSHCLEAEHVAFIEAFRALDFPAQCLFVRLAGRKGVFFDTLKLRYPEIKSLRLQVDLLRQAGFIRAVSHNEFEGFLGFLTKPDLIKLLKTSGHGTIKSSASKAHVLDKAKETLSFDRVEISDGFIVQSHDDILDYFLFLYFGRPQANLEKFTLGDLGIRAAPNFKTDYRSRFEDLSDATTSYFFHTALRQVKSGSSEDVATLIDTVDHWPEPVTAAHMVLADRLLFQLAKMSERLEDIPTALDLYMRSEGSQCRERVVRLRYARGDKDWCEKQLISMFDDPVSDAEFDFASDFYARKFGKKRTSFVTDLMRSADTLCLDESQKLYPERAVADHLGGTGAHVFHTENSLWRMLFGMTFWDILFGREQSALFNRFDRLPQTLKDGRFFDEHADAISDRLTRMIDHPDLFPLDLLKVFTRHNGRPNGMFGWDTGLFDLVQRLAKHAPVSALANMLETMARDFRNTKDGFPDLMCLREDDLSFLEVKTEGDALQRHQFTRIRQLRRAGFKAEILRVEWRVRRDQTYVVVDVETTGGRSGAHRVTEIGAVKIRDGKVIDEFQTLLNPERPIPHFITGLTGISQDMVKDAPRFADIAEEFAAFLSGAIFVAHNVKFDFGFIRAEFARLDKRYSSAQVCTCSGMRKAYPGLKSYSLKNLCKHFGISLNQHHRALCDARAAAELLCLMQDQTRDEAA